MISLNACVRVTSDPPPAICPPVLEYTQAEQARLADELGALPVGALIAEWLSDYSVMREQARFCAKR